MLGFAARTYARFSTNYVTNNLDNFLIGWRLGSAALGFYKKAYDLFALPNFQLLSGGAIAVAAFMGIGLGVISRTNDANW